MHEICAKLKRSLQAADSLYHRLVLLVGDIGTGKTSVLREVADDLETGILNVNLALSKELLDLTDKQRILRLPAILDKVTLRSSPLLLDNLEILFDQDLRQDPLRLLQKISRNRTVLATWNGSFNAGKLLYAEPGHPESRAYFLDETLLIVSMDGSASIDTIN